MIAKIKAHWKLLLVILGVIGGIYVYTKKHIEDDFNAMKASYDKEIAAITAARDAEVAQHKKNEDDLTAALNDVEKKYVDATNALDDAKKSRAKDIVITSKTPSDLAQKLSDATGFKIMVTK